MEKIFGILDLMYKIGLNRKLGREVSGSSGTVAEGKVQMVISTRFPSGSNTTLS